jgi:hypothetical protein
MWKTEVNDYHKLHDSRKNHWIQKEIAPDIQKLNTCTKNKMELTRIN